MTKPKVIKLTSQNGPLRVVLVVFVTSLLMFMLTADLLYGQAQGRLFEIYNIHTKETLRVVYKRNGNYIPSAMKKIDHIMRDWRRNESRVMRKDLIDLMWEIHNQTGSKKPIYLISGYRSLKTNNKLRKVRGGQARRSRHILGMAADMHFPDIPVRELRETALIRERGGVGYYPTSGLPFVHVDVGRVRHWPRATRAQLARLFPKGRSKHIPRDGRPLTKADARKYGAKQHIAKLRRIQLARAQTTSKGTAIAALTPPPLRTSIEPKTQYLDRESLERQLAALEKSKNPAFNNTPEKQLSNKAKITPKIEKAPQRPLWQDQTIAGLHPTLTETEEQELIQLAAVDSNLPKSWQSFIPPKKAQIIETANVAYSPEVDEEHEDELNYRPFSLAPLLTAKPVAEDQALAKLSVPDYVKTDALFTVKGGFSSSRFRPGLQHAYLIWANQFIGSAIPDPTGKNKR